jgi:hypothetical protein
MKRLDTASIDEEGSSRRIIGGFPVKLVKVCQHKSTIIYQ